MKILRKKINYLIEKNKEELLNCHLNNKGVAVALEENKNGDQVVNVYTDKRKIAFSVDATKGNCSNCSSAEFIATQTCYLSVIVDSNGEFQRNAKEDIAQSLEGCENPSGRFTCANPSCEKVYESRFEIESGEESIVEEIINSLSLMSIGVQQSLHDLYDAIDIREQGEK